MQKKVFYQTKFKISIKPKVYYSSSCTIPSPKSRLSRTSLQGMTVLLYLWSPLLLSLLSLPHLSARANTPPLPFHNPKLLFYTKPFFSFLLGMRLEARILFTLKEVIGMGRQYPQVFNFVCPSHLLPTLI